MNDSQCLDDFPVVSRWTAVDKQEVGVRDFYCESQRLALEELVSGGREAYTTFLDREKMPGFLSSQEIEEILSSTVRASETTGETLDQSFTGSQGQSTGTYFPDVSDMEVPDLDLGWPTFPGDQCRGVTQVEVHFQPNYGDLIYSCKEAIRNLIRKAKQVIALVMDSFTDIDILQDLHEACRRKRIPVYILLDQSGLPLFQQMCRDAGVWVDEERKMRVRTLKGCTYYSRTGAKVIGKVHEKFLLIDCEKVATGSYSFTWTDGKLNRSNLTVLSGQLAEYYDEEFRILYAQSEPIPSTHMGYGKQAIYEELTMKRLVAKDPALANALRQGIVKSTPRKLKPADKRPRQESPESTDQRACEASALAGNVPLMHEEVRTISTQTELQWMPEARMQGVSTQTCILTKEMETQTSFLSQSSDTPTSGVVQRAQVITSSVLVSPTTVGVSETMDLPNLPPASTAESTDSSSTSSGTTGSEGQPCRQAAGYPHLAHHSADATLWNYFQKLSKERQMHYSTIRSKLNNMVAILSRNRHLNAIRSREAGQYTARDRRELTSRVFGHGEVPTLASFTLRN
ncbi:protein FAM83D-B-like [Rhinoraja longicauda]